ncbi:MAG: carboxypeptidase-like regulatory domain-containing protein [Bacteroidia bacterium]|nr:carboxypeptidase-like regulatory domain-containing protein [Bacteroidia bacterium]
MKKIRIFLASSAELDQDKLQVELFISRKNKDWHDKRIFLELTTWKDFISSMTVDRTQNEYNRYIRTSEIAIFLFHTKLGRYTKEEFDHAHQAYLACRGKIKKPRIYTYFKTDPDETIEIKEFRKYIDSLDHFYDTYENMDELFVKINRQLDKLENEGLVIKPESIDLSKIIKYAVYYFLLPLLVLGGAIMTYYYFQPANMTVKVSESNSVPGFPFRQGKVTLTYGDKTENLEIKDEVIFKQIPSKYKHKLLKLIFEANGFVRIDTMVSTSDLVELNIHRDNSLAVIFGVVRDENNIPLKDVVINVKDMIAKTDGNGKFRIDIPFWKQAEEQRLTAWKTGYQTWDFTGTPSETQEWKIILKK